LVGTHAETESAPVSVCELGSTFLIIRQHYHVWQSQF
jgi:hypothetical protein